MLLQNFKETADSTSVWLELGTFPMPVELGMYCHPFYWIWPLPYFPFFIHYFSPHVSAAFCPEAASLWTCRFSPSLFLLIAPKDPEGKKCQNDCPHNRTACSVLRLFLESLCNSRETDWSLILTTIFLNGRERCVCMFRDFFKKKKTQNHLPSIYLFLQWK